MGCDKSRVWDKRSCGVEWRIRWGESDHAALAKQVNGGIAESAVMIRVVADQMTNQRQEGRGGGLLLAQVDRLLFLPASYGLSGMSWDGVDGDGPKRPPEPRVLCLILASVAEQADVPPSVESNAEAKSRRGAMQVCPSGD